MTLGNLNGRQSQKRKQAALAKAFPKGIRCQKCLEYGHWSYECKGQRKILMKPSRTQVLKKNMKSLSGEGSCSNGSCKLPNSKNPCGTKSSKCSDSSSDSSGSSSGSSDSDSSSDDSGSESGNSDDSDASDSY